MNEKIFDEVERLRFYDPDLYVWFEERAAIMQFDAGLTKEEAERERWMASAKALCVIARNSMADFRRSCGCRFFSTKLFSSLSSSLSLSGLLFSSKV